MRSNSDDIAQDADGSELHTPRTGRLSVSNWRPASSPNPMHTGDASPSRPAVSPFMLSGYTAKELEDAQALLDRLRGLPEDEQLRQAGQSPLLVRMLQAQQEGAVLPGETAVQVLADRVKLRRLTKQRLSLADGSAARETEL